MNSGRTARERVRAELIGEITEIARTQLATEGAAGLSLRAVAREMGMVSSAIYRYFASRDELLTALIVDAYNAVGEAVEAADAASDPADYPGRWLAVCRAVRTWGLDHPHEYALIYGSPVPGYQAPQITVPAAIRDTAVYGRIVSEAFAAGALKPPDICPPPPASFASDAALIRESIMPGLPDEILTRALVAWTALFGSVNFELFGQYNNVIDDRDALFDHNMTCLGRLLGLADPAGP